MSETQKSYLDVSTSDQWEMLKEQSFNSELLRNRVYWVNPHIQMPFNIKRGRSVPLGRMLTNENPGKNNLSLETHNFHYRSALLGKVVFKDNEGRIYRDVDLKGTGDLVFDLGSKQLILNPLLEYNEPDDVPQRSLTGPFGLTEFGYAKTDRDMSEKFLQKGIRTYRVMAIIELLELISDGNKYSLAEAKRRKIINEDDEPVIEVRAFATKMRVINGLQAKPGSLSSAYIEDAKKLMTRELGREEQLSNYEYIKQFAIWLGQSLGIMHREDFVHRYITIHNITLDARLVDLDGVKTRAEVGANFSRMATKDLKEAYDALMALSDALKVGGSFAKDKNLSIIFLTAYKEAYPKERYPEVIKILEALDATRKGKNSKDR